MAVRYEGDSGEPDLELVDQVNTFDLNTQGKGYYGKLSTVLQWHKQDPLDSFEINRNNVVYTYQKNRNPFIDHTEYVKRIWSNLTAATLTVKVPEFRVYPNPTKDFLNIELETNKNYKGFIYLLTGGCVLEFQTTGSLRLSTDNLNSGSYILMPIHQDGLIHRSKVIIMR